MSAEQSRNYSKGRGSESTSNDRTASLSTDVKNLKEDMKQCKKIGREIEDLSQYLRRDCLELTGVLPTEEVSCFDLVWHSTGSFSRSKKEIVWQH